VGEYEVVILSAKDSMGLDTWLRQEKYNIPAGAEPVLKPYVQAGMKFFVAKVNIDKVAKEGDKTMLSPLRFHYDSDRFELPVRLGLLNSSGKQDLLVHILARGQALRGGQLPQRHHPHQPRRGRDHQGQFGDVLRGPLRPDRREEPEGRRHRVRLGRHGTCDPCPGPTLARGPGPRRPPGGPPGTHVNPWSPPAPPAAAREVAFAPRGKTPLASFLVNDLSELGVKGKAPTPSPVKPASKPDSDPAGAGGSAASTGAAPAAGKGCGSGCAVPQGGGADSASAAAALAALLLGRRQRRRSARTGSHE
jgi:hypothetical protein